MGKPLILTVDDDPLVAAAITRDLSQEYGVDYRLISAHSGAQALSVLTTLALRDEQVALIVADQRMPQMTGIEMLAQAGAHAPDAKLLLLTAYADTDVAITAINQIGLDYYLLKPWDPPEEKLYPVIDALEERVDERLGPAEHLGGLDHAPHADAGAEHRHVRGVGDQVVDGEGVTGELPDRQHGPVDGQRRDDRVQVAAARAVHHVAVGGDDGPQVLAQLHVHRRAVIDRTDADVEELLRDVARLLGDGLDQRIAERRLPHHVRIDAGNPEEPLALAADDGGEGLEDRRDEHRAQGVCPERRVVLRRRVPLRGHHAPADGGEPADMIFHLRREPAAFANEKFGDIVLVSTLFGQAVANLARARELQEAERSMKEQYDIIAKLSNTVMDSALDLKDYSKLLETRVRERTAELAAARGRAAPPLLGPA